MSLQSSSWDKNQPSQGPLSLPPDSSTTPSSPQKSGPASTDDRVSSAFDAVVDMDFLSDIDFDLSDLDIQDKTGTVTDSDTTIQKTSQATNQLLSRATAQGSSQPAQTADTSGQAIPNGGIAHQKPSFNTDITTDNDTSIQKAKQVSTNHLLPRTTVQGSPHPAQTADTSGQAIQNDGIVSFNKAQFALTEFDVAKEDITGSEEHFCFEEKNITAVSSGDLASGIKSHAIRRNGIFLLEEHSSKELIEKRIKQIRDTFGQDTQIIILDKASWSLLMQRCVLAARTSKAKSKSEEEQLHQHTHGREHLKSTEEQLVTETHTEKYERDVKNLTLNKLQIELQKREIAVKFLEDSLRKWREHKKERFEEAKRERQVENELNRELLKIEVLKREISNREIQRAEGIPLETTYQQKETKIQQKPSL